MTDQRAIVEAIKKATAGMDGVEIYISVDRETGDMALHAVVPLKREEHIVFADGECPRCGAMTHNYGGPIMRCPECGWTEQEGAPDAIDGMCCDCLHEREPFCGDYSENVACPDRREDGSCWTARWEEPQDED